MLRKGVLAASVLSVTAGGASAQEKRVVWFTKGFYPA